MFKFQNSFQPFEPVFCRDSVLEVNLYFLSFVFQAKLKKRVFNHILFFLLQSFRGTLKFKLWLN